jgi:hypothetical protein
VRGASGEWPEQLVAGVPAGYAWPIGDHPALERARQEETDAWQARERASEAAGLMNLDFLPWA